MRLGTEEILITPPLPIIMGGYGARNGPANDISSDLKARTFVFENGEKKVGLITVDIILLSNSQIERIKERAAKLIDINKKDIIISCSHTHSGPATRSFSFENNNFNNPYSLNLKKPDPEYMNWLLKALAGSFIKAEKNMVKVKLHSISDKLENLGKNRRDPELPIDDQLTVLAFENENKNLEAVIINYSCHPTVLGAANLAISPDFPGEAINQLKKIYPETIFGFINGSAGDVSTRFTRREQTIKEVKRFGSIMAAKVVTLLNEIEYDSSNSKNLKTEQLKLTLSFKNYPSLEELNSEIKEKKIRLEKLKKNDPEKGELRIAKTDLQGALVQKKFASIIKELENNIKINICNIGNIVIITIPGELFSKLGMEIKKCSPFKETIVATYSNGYIGYIPDKNAYEEKGYESLSTPLKKGFGEIIVENICKKVKKLY